jgi:macrolide transport system ATP-binding/permease protein
VGIMPALRAARTDVITVLHEGGRGSSSGPRRQLARNALVAAQVAGSLVLLVVAGLFVRSLEKAQQINLGFNPDHVFNLSVDVQQIGYKEPRGREFFREIDSRIRALPGVESVAQAFTIPLGYISSGDRIWIESHPLESGQQPADVSYNMVSSGYLDTLQIPLLRGRKFRDADGEKAPGVAIINQSMAKKFWPNEDALGRRFSTKGANGPFTEIVGIVQDGKYQNVAEDPQPFFYLPLDQSYMSIRTIHVRTSVPPETLALQIESQIHELAPDLPITQVQTMTESLQGANGFFFFRFGAQLTATMGFLGLILAVVGIYSVVSYAAVQRTQEIGIRMAMGAAPRDILKMVLRQGLGVVGIGLALGLVVALAGTRVMGSLFVGIKPSDPLTFIVVVLLLTGIALFACWIPAYRATRIDPLAALRYE